MSASSAKPKIAVILTQTPTPEEGAIWMFYSMGRANYITQHPELYDSQSGDGIPTFGEEVFGRFMLADGASNNVKHGKPVPSAYLADVLKVHEAGYLSEYVWWFLNRPSWPTTQQPAQLLPFMFWASKELQNHKVETYGGVRFDPIESATDPDSAGASGSRGVPSSPLDIHRGGGEALRPQVDAIAARLREGNVPEAARLLESFERDVQALQDEAETPYLCFRSDRELAFFLAENPAVRRLRVLDWCVPEGMYLRAYLLSQLQRPAEALACLDAVLKLAPLFARASSERGFVLSRVRRPREAAAAYTRAWELASRLPENAITAGPALRGLAVACVDLGDWERAEKLLRDSLVINPGNPVATQELDYIAQCRLGGRTSPPGSNGR